jgi:hypothetical protein
LRQRANDLTDDAGADLQPMDAQQHGPATMPDHADANNDEA